MGLLEKQEISQFLYEFYKEKYEESETDKNVLKSIKNNTLGRNKDVKETIELLERIEGNFFISLDAKWGNGKTFFVRQTEKTLEYLTKREWAMNEAEKTQAENLKKFFEKTDLESLNIKQSYLPIYYIIISVCD